MKVVCINAALLRSPPVLRVGQIYTVVGEATCKCLKRFIIEEVPVPYPITFYCRICYRHWPDSLHESFAASRFVPLQDDDAELRRETEELYTPSPIIHKEKLEL